MCQRRILSRKREQRLSVQLSHRFQWNANKINLLKMVTAGTRAFNENWPIARPRDFGDELMIASEFFLKATWRIPRTGHWLPVGDDTSLKDRKLNLSCDLYTVKISLFGAHDKSVRIASFILSSHTKITEWLLRSFVRSIARALDLWLLRASAVTRIAFNV